MLDSTHQGESGAGKTETAKAAVDWNSPGLHTRVHDNNVNEGSLR